MQRLLIALVALISFFSLAVRPAQAQKDEGSVEPTNSPQRMDRSPESTNASPMEGARPVTGDTVQVDANETRDNVSVQNQPLILEGTVKHDVVAIHSEVMVKPGAKVGGHLILFGGHVDNQAGRDVRVVRVNADAATAFGGITPGLIAVPNTGGTASAPERARAPKGNWSGAQLALFVFGLLSGLVALIVSPRGTQQASNRIEQHPGRCLMVGGIGVLFGLAVSLLNAALMRSGLGLLYAPLGAIVALVPLALLVYGWLCGMRYTGDLIARRFGRHHDGPLYARIALGLGAFCLVNLILGESLGAIGAIGEFIVAAMGLGAVLITGGGTDSEWLDARLRGESRWFARGRRW